VVRRKEGPMKISFTKMHAAGNDFILIDDRNRKAGAISKTAKRKLCARKIGIGADGILILEKDRDYPFMMRYFNADGGEAALCGNGARCVAFYAFTKGFVPRRFVFRSKSGIHSVSIYQNGSIKLTLPPCIFHRPNRIMVSGEKLPYSSVTVGVPHIVIFVHRLAEINVPTVGKRLRNLKRFRPHGVNVNFVMVTGSKRLRVRTYERGVENETLACGSGVAATAAVALRRGSVTSPVKVETASGETIVVQLKKSGDTLLPNLIGKAHFVFSGTATIP
jgi:diaminopimelate epimerase